MGFEWDERKREGNLRHHKIDFVDVLPLFEGKTLEIVDDRFDYGDQIQLAWERLKGGSTWSSIRGVA